MTQCAARSKRTGQQCQVNAMRGRKHCYHHGGKSLVGPSSPAWVDGKYSKYLPKRLLDDYQKSLSDPDKLALTEELAMLDGRISDVVRRVDSGESGRVWRMLREAAMEFRAARRAGDPDRLIAATNALVDLAERGYADWAAWSEVVGLIERRRKLVESERKRAIEMQQMISTEQAMGLMGLLIQSVREHVRDTDALRAITNDFLRITGPSHDGGAIDAAVVDDGRPMGRRAARKPDAA